MTKSISFLGKVIKGDVEISNPSFFEPKYKKFLEKNKGEHVEVTYKVVDKASHAFY
ncbi:MAG: hypothetical protein GY782_06810, partial [Gammaproteobacteria bacterium]|nr:hypothetical protein [Gammaproteobacteria bacterium]